MQGLGQSNLIHDFNAYNASNQIWNGTAFESEDVANYAAYRIAATKVSNANDASLSTTFAATEPTGTVRYLLRERGASLALSTIVWQDTTPWNMLNTLGMESANLASLINAVVGKNNVTLVSAGVYDIEVRNAADDAELVTIRYNSVTGEKTIQPGGPAAPTYGAEMLANIALASAVSGTPGTAPTSWYNIQSTGSLSTSPLLTFDTINTRRAIFQTFAVTAGKFKLAIDAVLNSGTAQNLDTLFYSAPIGSTVEWYIDAALSSASEFWTGSKKLTAIITVPISGTLEFRMGAGVVGERTQNVTITNPTLKKQL